MTTDDRNIASYAFFRHIAALPFVDRVVLFGSRARGDHHDRSDIDLAVFCAGADADDWREVKNCLREGRIDTLLKVDCVRFDDSTAALREQILREGRTLYDRSNAPDLDRLLSRLATP